MWDPYDEGANDAHWRQDHQRTTPLLARRTPALRDETVTERVSGEEWPPLSAEWTGSLPVPKGQWERGHVVAERVASIEEVPYELLGWADRMFLLHWARKGYPVYAYRAPTGQWNLWLDYWRVTLPLPEHLRLTPPGMLSEDDF